MQPLAARLLVALLVSWVLVPRANAAGECALPVRLGELDAGVAGPRLWTPAGVPIAGQPFALQVVGGPPLGVGRLALGRRVEASFVPELGALWFVAPPLHAVPLVLDGSGSSAELVTGSLGPSACGLVLVAQAVAVDGTTGERTVSNGLRMRVGRPPADVFPGSVVLLEPETHDVAVGDFDGDGHLDLAAPGSHDALLAVALGEGNGVFRRSETLALSDSDFVLGDPTIVAAELTGDDAPDLAVALDQFGGRLFLLSGNGDGTFAPLAEHPLGGRPESIASADFDGDGWSDLATASRTDSSVELFLGSAAGPVATAAPFATASDPLEMAVADLDGDGFPDLAVACRLDDAVTVLLGDESGGFARLDLAAGVFRPSGIAAGDLDADGDVDLVTTGAFDEVAVLLGAGDGAFVPGVVETSPIRPVGPRLVDLDADGALDLVVTHDDGTDLPNSALGVFLGAGDGTWEERLEVAGREDGHDVVAGDWNEDGRVDLGVSHFYGEVDLFLGRGDGTFAPSPVALDEHGSTVRVADLDGDGLLDVANRGFEDVRVFLNEGGAFAKVLDAPIGDGSGDFVLGDWDADGLVDVADVSLFGDVAVARGLGDGTFGAVTTLAAHESPRRIAAADLDADGDLDLLVANRFSDDLSVLVGLPGLAFAPAVHYPTVDYEPLGGTPRPLVGDLDGDGAVDVLVGDDAGEAVVLLGAGDGTLVAGPALLGGAETEPAALFDLDQDGDLDLLAHGDATVHLFLGLGGGTFGAEHVVPVPPFTRDVQVGDVDGDGVLDLVTVSLARLVVHRGLGGLVFEEGVAHATTTQPGEVVLADVDLDGNLDAVPSELTLFLNLSGDPGTY